MFSKFIWSKIAAAKASDLDRSLFLWAASKHPGNVSFTLSSFKWTHDTNRRVYEEEVGVLSAFSLG